MARLGDDGNTPAGLVGACLATVMALRHPVAAMNPVPRTCLTMALARLTNSVSLYDGLIDYQLSISLGQPLLSLLYLLCLPAMTHHACCKGDTEGLFCVGVYLLL